MLKFALVFPGLTFHAATKHSFALSLGENCYKGYHEYVATVIHLTNRQMENYDKIYHF